MARYRGTVTGGLRGKDDIRCLAFESVIGKTLVPYYSIIGVSDGVVVHGFSFRRRTFRSLIWIPILCTV